MTARKYDPICSFPECGRSHNARGLCNSHGVMQRKGEPLRPIQPRTGPIAKDDQERFAAKVRSQPNGCIEWVGGKTSGGYGVFSDTTGHASHRKVMAHRWSYETARGPIPHGYDIDHLCRNRACVNPNHLEPVTRQENIRRATRLKQNCPAGHPYSEENTYIRPGTSHRRCRTCSRARDDLRRDAKNAKRRAVRAALRSKE